MKYLNNSTFTVPDSQIYCKFIIYFIFPYITGYLFRRTFFYEYTYSNIILNIRYSYAHAFITFNRLSEYCERKSVCDFKTSSIVFPNICFNVHDNSSQWPAHSSAHSNLLFKIVVELKNNIIFIYLRWRRRRIHNINSNNFRLSLIFNCIILITQIINNI